MKVILVSTFYKPSVGGVERQVEEIFNGLLKRGIDAEVYTTDASHSKDKRLKDSESNSRVKRFKYLFGFGYFFRFSPKLIWSLMFTKFDIVHVHNAHDAHLIPIILIRIFRGKKLVLTGHNPFVVDDSKRSKNLTLFVRFFDFVISIFSFAVDKYIALLESEMEYVTTKMNFKEHSVAIIPNGIRDEFYNEFKIENNILLEEFAIDTTKYKLVAGCLCRMDFVKGIQNLKSAVDQNPDSLFIFAGGDGGYLSELKQLYQNNKNVVFTNRYLNIEESLHFYNLIDAFLLPSVYEPFGITLVEAMTQGKYILATSNGGPKEIIVADYGEVLKPDDLNGWAESIRKIKESKNEYILKGQQGIVVSRHYMWDNVIDKLIEQYNEGLLK